jgi:hypothetical protein
VCSEYDVCRLRLAVRDDERLTTGERTVRGELKRTEDCEIGVLFGMRTGPGNVGARGEYWFMEKGVITGYGWYWRYVRCRIDRYIDCA